MEETNLTLNETDACKVKDGICPCCDGKLNYVSSNGISKSQKCHRCGEEFRDIRFSRVEKCGFKK